jgi:hypothetical protein
LSTLVNFRTCTAETSVEKSFHLLIQIYLYCFECKSKQQGKSYGFLCGTENIN